MWHVTDGQIQDLDDAPTDRFRRYRCRDVSTCFSWFRRHRLDLQPPICGRVFTRQEEEKEFYMLRPVNKTDHMQQGMNVAA